MLTTSIWKHFAAFVYDIFPIIGILIVSSGVVLIFRSGNNVQPYTWWFITLIYFEIAMYYIYFWKVGGQTIGMQAWKIKIRPQNNQSHLSWTQASIRFVIGFISTLLLGLGIFWKLYAKDNRSWMDIASNSNTIIDETSRSELP